MTGLGQKTIFQFCSGDYHSGCVTMSGQVFMWGSNTSFECGIEKTENAIYVPVNITQMNDDLINEYILDISCSSSRTVFLNDRGFNFL